MTRDKWKDALELVGILGIVGSLVLVAYELRQNTATARAQATFLVNTSLDSAYRARAQNSTLAQLIKDGHDAPETLTDVEREQFFAWLRADLNSSEALWFFYQNGLIAEEDFDGYRFSICSRLITDGGREYWAVEADFFASGFREVIDEWCFE